MSERLPMFGLNTVLFPGTSLPLNLFEDRYLAMVEHLLAIPDLTERLFFSVAIREGYEVGERGVQSLYRIGCRLQLTEVSRQPDGSYQVIATVRDRVNLLSIHTDRAFPEGEVELFDEAIEPVPQGLITRAKSRFAEFVDELSRVGRDLELPSLPTDPTYLSWVLSALVPFAMAEKQSLLEASGPASRLIHLVQLMEGELRAMAAIPSLPATELARTRWSPN
jgi:uncharacterized protein